MNRTCFAPAALLAAASVATAASAAAGSGDGAPPERAQLDEPGSLLIYPNIELRWNAAGELLQDTVISLINDSATSVTVQILYVNGDPALAADPPERAHPGWNWVDGQLVLTPHQPMYWSAATGQPAPIFPLSVLDPGTPPGRPDPDGSSDRVLRAFAYVFAVNGDDEQIRWNHLTGHASTVHYADEAVSEYEAVAYQALVGQDGETVGTPGTIRLDGFEYGASYDRLLLDFQAPGSSAFSGPGTPVTSAGDLTLQVAAADLRQASAGAVTTLAAFEVWNQNEFKFTGMRRCITCWDQTLLANYGPPNHFVLPALQTDHGWARINGQASLECDGPGVQSAAAAMVGVSTRVLDFDGGSDRAASAVALRGDGVDGSAIVRYDVAQPPPPIDVPGARSTIAGVPTEHIGTGAGSLLIFPNVELRWDAAGNLLQDTFITLQNQGIALVHVQFYFLNGDPPLDAAPPEPAHPGWDFFDAQIALTASQPVYWSLYTGQPLGLPPFSVLDPGSPPGRPDPDGGPDRVLRGTVYAWAVNGNSEEIRWNNLTGGATVVNYANGMTWEHRAYAVPVVDPNVPEGGVTGTPGVLALDGTELAPGFDQLILDFQAVGADGFSGPVLVVADDTDLTLLPISVDFRQANDGPLTTKANFDVWNMNEVKFSGAYRCVTCWDQTLLGSYGPPNHFLLISLQTDRGTARIDGRQSSLCDFDYDPNDGALGCSPFDVVSADAALIGTSATLVTFDGISDSDTAGSTLVGLGEQPATVRYDPLIPPPPDDGTCDADLNNNGAVDFGDLLVLLGFWGPCCCQADLDLNGEVGFSDLLIILGSWGPC